MIRFSGTEKVETIEAVLVVGTFERLDADDHGLVGLVGRLEVDEIAEKISETFGEGTLFGGCRRHLRWLEEKHDCRCYSSFGTSSSLFERLAMSALLTSSL